MQRRGVNTADGDNVEIHDNDSTSSDEDDDPNDKGIMKRLTFKYAFYKFKSAFLRSLTNRYMFANIVYLVYAIGILIIDYNLTLNSNVPLSDINNFYLGLGVLHLCSAVLYLWSWKYFSWIHIIMIPEYLNMVEASLYITSASMYNDENPYYYTTDLVTLNVHRIELTAALVEFFASIGWIITWWMAYERVPGRGWSLDDPDVIAFLCTFGSSCVYITYYIEITLHPEEYATNFLYENGDIVYFVGSVYYLLASMRDDGWFWFMPLAGRWKLKKVLVNPDGTPKEIEHEPKVPGTFRRFLLNCGLPALPETLKLQYWFRTAVRALWGKIRDVFNR